MRGVNTDLTGRQIGKLLILKNLGPASSGHYEYEVLCKLCGQKFKVRADALTKPTPQISCFACAARNRVRHGLTNSVTYIAWKNAKKRYRGRMHQPWVDSFETFYADVGCNYTFNTRLICIDTSKPYAPDNIKWVKRKKKCNCFQKCRK